MRKRSPSHVVGDGEPERAGSVQKAVRLVGPIASPVVRLSCGTDAKRPGYSECGPAPRRRPPEPGRTPRKPWGTLPRDFSGRPLRGKGDVAAHRSGVPTAQAAIADEPTERDQTTDYQ
jgi:hypothetical protein